jgi:hypothetical protein
MTPAAGRFAAVASPVVLATVLAAAAAGEPPATNPVLGGPSILLSHRSGASAYSGVGRYEGSTTCTAFFLDTGPIPDDAMDAPAYAVTSGVCAGESSRVIFNFFHDSADQVPVPVVDVVHASPDAAGIAVLELGATHMTLLERLVRPLRVPFFASITVRDPVLVVGAPLRPDPVESFLRAASCRIKAVAPVATRCRDVLPGSAGSPVVSLLDRLVVAVIVTTAPSEEDPSFAAPITGLANCFDAYRRFEVRAPDCPLDPVNGG